MAIQLGAVDILATERELDDPELEPYKGLVRELR
jgi:hypothetical protein